MVDALVNDSLFLIDVSFVHDLRMRYYVCWYEIDALYDTCVSLLMRRYRLMR
jgi:hypothetical protein